MNGTIEKTLVLVLLILLGMALKGKFAKPGMVDGLKELVLAVALPATILIAMLKIPFDPQYLLAPILMLCFNVILYLIMPYLLELFGIEANSAKGRTARILLPSFAPGLSCFPFIVEYLDDKSLGVAAMSDLGNKVFVLIFLYLAALKIYLSNNLQEGSNGVKTKEKIKNLLASLAKEPINVVVLVGLALIFFHYNYSQLPLIFQDLLDKTSLMMTPLILIYIGLAVKLKQKKRATILSVLTLRAGISFLLSGLSIYLLGIKDMNTSVLCVVLPLSAVSFWPFAHISFFNEREHSIDNEKRNHSFDIPFALLILAFSLPFSSTLILAVLSFKAYVSTPLPIFSLGALFCFIGLLPVLVKKIRAKVNTYLQELKNTSPGYKVGREEN